MILRSAQGENALQVRGSAAVDELCDFRRSDAGDRFDSGVIADGFDDVPAAVHNLEHAFRKPGLAQATRESFGA